jgi:hypothetical protein
MVLLAHKGTAKIDRFDYHVLFLAILFNFPPKKAMRSNKRTFSTRHPSERMRVICGISYLTEN